MFTNDDMDAVFAALAHQTRRRVLDLLRDSPGLTVGALALEFDVSRIAVMNHLAVLEKANLVISEKDGRSRRLFLNGAPLQLIHERWLDKHSAYWAGRMTLIKSIAEAAVAEPQDDDHD